MMTSISSTYLERKKEIVQRLDEFCHIDPKNYFWELVFCLLTPQSKAEKCWQAVQELKKLSSFTQQNVAAILREYTRFHNNKASYVLLVQRQWPEIVVLLKDSDRKQLRNLLADSIKGLGLKEAGHFLRNIGKSDNQIAILDRHVLKHMHAHNVISQPTINGKRDYFIFEEKYLLWAKEIGISPDELDLVLWSLETGKVFK